jgi:aerobic-type carbon monoxide dehydrogenase small subunit (CoxS/CutS family)
MNDDTLEPPAGFEIQKNGDGVSRRSFLSGASATAVGSAMLDSPLVAEKQAVAQTVSPVVGPNTAPISLHINGSLRTLAMAPHVTLAEVLRDVLGLTGTKISCDRGACSACTVWLDGVAVASCMILAVDIAGRSVTTIEGLADGDKLHRVQAAFVEHDAMQCGFCTPGMVMSCAALVDHNPSASADDVKAAISGHLCRCGAYQKVVEATLAAAQQRKG